MAYLTGAFVIAAVGASVIWRKGMQLGLADIPNERSAHSSVVPKGGGVGIAAAIILAAFLYGLPLAFAVPLVIIAIVGLAADRTDWNHKLRLLLMLLCAYAPVSHYGFWFAVFAALLLATTANFYNFMDGIDGIAALCGTGAFALLSVLASLNGYPAISGFAICAAAACAGFVPFNYPKARVFMGDVGSLVLGFSFAWAALAICREPADLLCALFFLWLFYADELLTMFLRVKNGENLFRPHRKHLYQLLANELKVPHCKISAAYAAIQFVSGLAAIALRPVGIAVLAAEAAFCAVLFFFAYKRVLNAVKRRQAGF